MNLKILIYGVFVLFSQSIHTVKSAKILGVFAYSGKSHFLVFQPILEELTRRGHQLTVASFFEKNTTKTNYTGILIPTTDLETTSFLSLDDFGKRIIPFTENLELVYFLTSGYDNVLSSKDIQSLANEKYDLILTEHFNSDIMFGLLHKIDAPVITMLSHDVFPWTNEAVGTPNNPSYLPNLLADLPPHMNFIERLYNMLNLLETLYSYNYKFRAEAQIIAEKYFGKLPPLSEIVQKKTSLMLVNTHFSLFDARPNVPAVIEVGGVHMAPVKPLPKNILNQIQNYDIVIYFSMGTVLDSGSMNVEKRDIFLKIFSELKNTAVLWKSKLELAGKPKNLILSDWYPQRDILANPKTKLFISHCGLLGTLEATHSGVPILCIPMLGDQMHNARAVAARENGMILNFFDITEQTLRKSIDELLNNPKYKENAEKVALAFNDRPLSPLDTSIYWIEYVIRHKGAPLIRSCVQHLTWYQYYNLDVIAVILVSLYLIAKLIIFIVRKIYLNSVSSNKVKTN